MIYVCVVAHNDAATVGLMLWKVRQVMAEHRWEYHLLVADDGSTDGTAETLDLYQRALPMSVIRQDGRRGYAASLEALLREAVSRTDRPKRDGAITLPASFAVSPTALPELLKRFASGADLVVSESAGTDQPLWERAVRRSAPWLLRPGLQLEGMRDVTSGVCLLRLSTLRHCLQDREAPLLETEGSCANAELIARAATSARQIAAVSLDIPAPTAAPHERPSLGTVFQLFRAGRRLRVPAASARVQRA